MTSIGLPVPPGMTITTDTCAAYYDHGSKMPSGLMDQAAKAIKTLEKKRARSSAMVATHCCFPSALVRPSPCRA